VLSNPTEITEIPISTTDEQVQPVERCSGIHCCVRIGDRFKDGEYVLYLRA
jgi:hypothetical protein